MSTIELMDESKMIERRVKRGHNREQSKTLLAELMKAHSGVNLDYALSYNAFTR